MKDFIIGLITTVVSIAVLVVMMSLPIGVVLLLWLHSLTFVQFVVVALKMGLTVMCILLVISVALGFLKE